MSPLEARQIIDPLAQGVDPESGEVLSDDEHVLQRPMIIRALFLASGALVATTRKKNESTKQASHAGNPWTEAEDQRLLATFDAGETAAQLAQSHERSKGGVASRLVRLGRIKERSELYARGT